MYFPLLKPHSRGKRSAAQPKSIYSEIPQEKYQQKEAETMTGMETQTFTVPDDKETMRHILRSVFDALNEKGYNPVNQIVGYLLTEDPTYITNYHNARSMICKIDRDELMQALVKEYLSKA